MRTRRRWDVMVSVTRPKQPEKVGLSRNHKQADRLWSFSANHHKASPNIRDNQTAHLQFSHLVAPRAILELVLLSWVLSSVTTCNPPIITFTMAGRGAGAARKTLLAPIHFIFKLLQQRSTVSIWLYEQLAFRIEGKIRVCAVCDGGIAMQWLTSEHRASMSS